MSLLISSVMLFGLFVQPAPSSAQSFVVETYSAERYEQAVDQGDVVLLHFTSERCTPCKRQRLFIEDIRLLNPNFDQAMIFMEVNFDADFNMALARELDLQRAGVLVLQKDGKVWGTLKGSTLRADIHSLMEKAFSAY